MITNYWAILSSVLIALLLYGCASYPKGPITKPNDRLDYSHLDLWAAHPEKEDNADLYAGGLMDNDKVPPPADIFFVHPTTYTGKAISDQWNAPIDHPSLNQSTDAWTIKYQASIFNKAGRIYAPRYRQAHIRTYFAEDSLLVKQVFDIAYKDVRDAFLHYLKTSNNGRPFIIAAHSQGTNHTERLIKEEIDGKKWQDQLIAAYLVGMPVDKGAFQNIPPCANARDTGCFISWRTFKHGYMPSDIELGSSITTHNPLSWKMDEAYISKEQNDGAVLRNFNKIIPNATDAQVENGILWAAKPKFPFSFLFTRKNYHIADFNFYYMNVRENAYLRTSQFLDDLKKRSTGSTR